MTDSHTTEYIARLREEPILLALADRVSTYLQRIGDHSSKAFISLRQAEHFYYKSSAVYNSMRQLVETTKQREAAGGARDNFFNLIWLHWRLDTMPSAPLRCALPYNDSTCCVHLICKTFQ